jgi:5-methyltetrahydropteroyltriglutamate--homocysteine methyltransferase
MDTIRADQVGSLLRPRELVEAWGKLFGGQLEPEALRAIEDRAIQAALDGQRRAGIDVYTDGEFRRIVYMSNLMQAVDGFIQGQGEQLPWKATGQDVPREMTEFSLPVVGERLRQKARLTGEESAFMRAHADGRFKITLPSPQHFMMTAYKPGLTDRVYATRAELREDLTRILADEAGQLAREGVPYIQLDAPTYTMFLDPSWDEWFAAHGVDKGQELAQAIESDGHILSAARVGGAVTGVHLCRGNGMGAWLSSGGYDPIAEQVFGLPADRLLLEYDTERAGSFEPLRLAPSDKTVVLGLVSTKTPGLESEDDLLRRIDEASRYVPAERLALSPQCGFASDFRGNPLREDDQWRKLELVADTARRAWPNQAARG